MEYDILLQKVHVTEMQPIRILNFTVFFFLLPQYSFINGNFTFILLNIRLDRFQYGKLLKRRTNESAQLP